MTGTRTGSSNSGDKGTATGMMAPAPAPAAVSDCEQGGKQVLMDNNDGIPWPYPALMTTMTQCRCHQPPDPQVVGMGTLKSTHGLPMWIPTGKTPGQAYQMVVQ